MRTSSIFKGEDIKQKSRTRFNVEADWGNNDSSRNIAQLFWLIWKCFKGSSWAVFLGLPRDSLVLPSQASKLWLDTPKNLGSKLELTCPSDTLKNQALKITSGAHCAILGITSCTRVSLKTVSFQFSSFFINM